MTKDEALKIALEALEGLINRTSGQSIYSFMETERRIAMSACVGIREALAQPEQTNIARHEANVQKFLNAPQSEQEPVAWRFTGIAGLKRYMTQKQYDAQTPEIKKWYEPFKCKNCTTPPQPEQEPVALPLVQFEKVAEGIEVGYDVFGGVDIRLGGEFVYVHINYDYRYTHNAERKALAKQIVGLLTTPPQRKPLTDVEIESLYENTEFVNWARSFARAIEAAHGIKE